MIVPKFDRDRIIQYAKEIGIEVREVAPGEGGVFIQEEDGSERELTTFDLFPETKEIADLCCALAGLIAENERLKEENERWARELAAIRDMLPKDYGFEEGTLEYAVAYPEGVRDLVKQTVERMKASDEFHKYLYEECDEYNVKLIKMLADCLPALDESKTDYTELSKEIREIYEAFSV
ncbi:hypothetical protein ABE068_05755 [Bacillus glycinifermentans]|uniref:Uncharacterized protein n=2 Tax=Bacillus glycinifermentans TaxID=1664069 RepID=A0ABU6HD90_9BACI|nr:hypothetical protein [Bacillus glycinifermentans]MEC0487971.1 hypothetical protein [Bacillus glycinifermentans]